MQIYQNKSLKRYNTFGIDAQARHFCSAHTVSDLANALQLKEYPEKFILSGGSNMLITGTIEALVIHINMKGREVVAQDDDHVWLKVMAGENWHETVLWTLDQDYGGLENMSLIPGYIGTAPIQNIGAYGVELKDTFVSCEAMEIATLNIGTFSKTDCAFGYRDSFFKNSGLGKYVITSVTFKLSKKNHQLNTAYGAIEAELKGHNITQPTLRQISDAVIAIRQSKLPDPKKLGNSGSFFKNPIIDGKAFARFTDKYPEAPFYKISEDAYKIPAGWLIEQCGYKGKRIGDAGVHKNQALVLVNYGNATGKEILDLAENIMDAVSKSFGIQISPEVNIIG
tara:strand:+ start:443 stop:1459 length:1017 start_codon:yes stop_codon:yes gene_type:complete